MSKAETYKDILSRNVVKAETVIPKARVFLKDTWDKQRAFGLFQPEENIIVIVKPSKENKVEAALGFPFPVARKELSYASLPDDPTGEITVCFRSGELRLHQRSQIVNQLGFESKVISREEMRSKLKELGQNKSRSFYVNPYSFLGDSLIGLYFLDRIKDSLGISDHIILSPSAEHQSFLEKIHSSKDQTQWNLVEDSDLVILPDLIDNHLPNTLLWTQHLMQRKIIALVIGRGLLIDYKAGIIHALDENDPLLRNSNIQDYMDDCLSQFIDTGTNKNPLNLDSIHYPFPNSTEAFINPFASLGIRDLTPEFIVTLVDGLVQHGVNKINISNGVKGSQKDEELISALRPLLEEKPTEIEYHWFDNLSGIAKLVTDRNINLLFSPDTSVPHMFNAMAKPVFTIYKSNFWDPRSIQSMASDSPLGFCRFQPSQIPILTGPEAKNITPLMWQGILNSFQKKISHKEATTWIEKIDSNINDSQQAPRNTLQILSECSAQLGMPSLMEAFDLKYFFNILSNFEEKDVKRLQESLVRISPMYKWLKLQLC